ncbi:MAG TPA: tetratricopeptide repeat protein [Thermoanaerobaculia bacterium]|nr:tetratricopeptide repeat protein [Thermoanaerobaculia bacterium]
MTKSRCLLIACLTLLLACPTFSQDARLGRVEMANSGAPAAQEPFLAGLAALHSFFYDEAADLFREAQRRDPGFALAYWGEAMTHNHPIWQEVELEAGREALAKLAPTAAERSAKAPTEREKLYLAATEALFGEGEKDARDEAYRAAMERIWRGFPGDREAAAFYALALQGLQRPGKMDFRRQMESAAILEPVFAANPLHPGAAHYLIHAYDDPTHAPLGLRAARVYAEIAPAAHHALHMPSHIFVQLGMWPEAAASNRAAYDASVAWVARRGHSLAKRDFHSLTWLHYTLLQLGRRQEAAALFEVAKEAAGQARADQALIAMGVRHAVETGESLLSEISPSLAEEGGGHAACATPAGGYRDPSQGAAFARGLLAVRDGRREAAEAARAELEVAAAGADGQTAKLLQVLERELAGLISLAEKHTEEGLARLAEAATLEAKLDFPSGPPEPVKPAHELYGEALLAAGRPAEARRELEQALARTPGRPAALLALARAAHAEGDTATARRLYARLAEIWRGADAGLPEVAEARAGGAVGATQASHSP